MRQSILKQISLIITIALIISTMSAFVLPKNTKAEENVNLQSNLEEETTEEEIPAQPDEYEMVAHRGYSGIAPENSMPAFQKAIEAGFTHIELDVQRCKENSEGKAEYVISHDDNLKRICGVNKKIEDMTVDEIKKYSYKAGNNVGLYNNLKILSYKELINYIKQVKADEENGGPVIDWRIELKRLTDDADKEKLESEIVDPLIEAGVEDRVTFISFYYSNLYNAIRNHTDIRICYLAEILEQKYLDYAISLRDKWHANIETVVFRGTTFTTDQSEMIAALKEGFKIGVYAIDSRVMLGSYYSMGVRSFTTNKITPGSTSISQMKQKYSIKQFTFALSKKSYTFTNTRKKPTFTITYEGEELLEGLCYEVSYANNKYPGTATATATGLRNITGEKDKSFSINMPKVKGFKIAKNKATSIKYQWTANTDVTGYKVYQYNYKTKKYKLVKTIKNNKTKTFTAKKLKTATKYRYRVKTYLTYNKKTYRSDPCAGKTTYTKPATEKLIKMTRSKKKKTIAVAFARLPRVTGYNVRIATDKNFTKDVKVKTTKTKKGFIIIRKLNKKKTYYAKVRGYLKVGSKYYYGAYSKVVHKKGKKAKKSKKSE